MLDKDTMSQVRVFSHGELTDATVWDYCIAPGGDGPLADEWRDKPWRLIYSLAHHAMHKEHGPGWETVWWCHNPNGFHGFGWSPQETSRDAFMSGKPEKAIPVSMPRKLAFYLVEGE